MLSADGLLAQILKKIERFESNAAQYVGTGSLNLTSTALPSNRGLEIGEGVLNFNESFSRVDDKSMLDAVNTSEIKEIKEDIEKLRELLEASVKQQDAPKTPNYQTTPLKSKTRECSEEDTRVNTLESAKLTGLLESTMQNQLIGIEESLKQQIDRILKENTQALTDKIREELEETKVIHRQVKVWDAEEPGHGPMKSLRESFLMNSAGKQRVGGNFNFNPAHPNSKRLERRHSSVIPSIPDFPDDTDQKSSQNEAGHTSSDQEEVNVEELGDKVPRFLAVPTISPPKFHHSHNRQRSFDMVSILSAAAPKPLKTLSLAASTQTTPSPLHMESCVGVLIRHNSPRHTDIQANQSRSAPWIHLTIQPMTGLQLAPQKRFRHPLSTQTKQTQTNILKPQIEASVQTEHFLMQHLVMGDAHNEEQIEQNLQVDEMSLHSREDDSHRIEVSKEVSTPSDNGPTTHVGKSKEEIEQESQDFSKALREILNTSVMYLHNLARLMENRLYEDTAEILVKYSNAQFESLSRFKNEVMTIDRQGFLLFLHFEVQRLSSNLFNGRKLLGHVLCELHGDKIECSLGERRQCRVQLLQRHFQKWQADSQGGEGKKIWST